MIEEHPRYNEIKDGLCGSEKLFNFLKDNQLIHHITSPDNFLKILNCGEIKYNNGSCRDSYPQSKNCYARYKKCISLFDIITPTFDELDMAIALWVSFTANKKVFINLNFNKISNKLILNQDFRDEARKLKKMRMPYIECIYPKSINLKLANSFLFVKNNSFKKYLNTEEALKQLKKDVKNQI